jgi:hypothetical protein
VSDRLITIADVRKAGFCVRGARRWMLAHGMDFNDFLTSGIAAFKLRATGDALALKILASIEEADHGR